MDVDFFKIGGNSLLGGRVLSRLRSVFAVELAITVIFNHRTITDLAQHIQPKLLRDSSTTDGIELNRKSHQASSIHIPA